MENKKEDGFIVAEGKVYKVISSIVMMVSREDFIALVKGLVDGLHKYKATIGDFDKLFVYGTVNGVVRNEVHFTKLVGNIYDTLQMKKDEK